MGGEGKGSPYAPLKSLIRQRARQLLLIGEDAPQIRKELGGWCLQNRWRLWIALWPGRGFWADPATSSFSRPPVLHSINTKIMKSGAVTLNLSSVNCARMPSLKGHRRVRIRSDHVLLFLTVLLMLFGLVMVFSASANMSEQRYGSAYLFLPQQLLWTLSADWRSICACGSITISGSGGPMRSWEWRRRRWFSFWR